MEEPGRKTYFVAIFGALGLVGLLTDVATPEQVGMWYSLWGIAGFGTLTHTIKKLKSWKNA
jgi:hypothetical protein